MGRAGSTDVSTLMRLLWRSAGGSRSRPGPRPRVSVDDIVAAGVEAADGGGLPDVTMRRVADALGVKVMTLYSHVPDKETLLDLMIDAVTGGFRLEVKTGAPLEDAVAALLDANYRLHLRHPWLMEVRSEQPPLGPGALGKYERELAVLEPFGLADTTMDAVLTFIQDFARGAAGDRVRRDAAPVHNADWWEAVRPHLDEYVDPAAYPLASRVGTAAGAELGGAYNAESAYRFGAGLVVRAITDLVERSA